MEFVMNIFVNISGVPLDIPKTIQNPLIVGGNETDITRHPYQVWSLCCCSVWRYFEVFEEKRPPVFVMTHLRC